LTDDRHRYIKSPRPELYDVLQDPRERNDLSETEAATLEQLRVALDALTANGQVATPVAPPDGERERLARMGYLAVDAIPPEERVDVKDRSDVHNRYWRACSLAAAGNPAGAIAAYQDVVKSDPRLAIAWDRLAALLLEAGKLKEAGAALVSLLRLYPDEARVAAAEARLQGLLAGGTPAPLPSADRAALAASVWTALGEKARAAEVRNAARKAVGDAAMRKAEAAFRK